MLTVDRKEDMSPNGYLRLIMEDDGDIIVSVAGATNGDDFPNRFADVQFCVPFTGGGGSSRTHRALRDLMAAMAEDNGDPHNGGRRGENEGADALAAIKRMR